MSDFLSGPWTGYYQQHGRNWAQDLDLSFRDGVMSGAGTDELGAFTVWGRYDVATREASWTKCYPDSHIVHYRGFREGKGIWGVWEIPAYQRSGFHIWPRGADAESLAERDRIEAPGPLVQPGLECN